MQAPKEEPLVLSKALALRSLTTIRSIWQRHASGELVLPVDVTLQGSCVTVRAGKAGKMLFVELLDGSTVRTLQCICDSTPDAVEGAAAPDPRLAIDWKPLFDHCHRGATVTLTGTLVSSPAAGQPIEMVVQSFKCDGPIEDPGTYFMSGRGFLNRDLLRGIPHQRHHTRLFTAIQIIKQNAYWAYHEAMHQLGIGELQPTLITGNECEEGAHPFTVTTLLDGKSKPSELPTVPETGVFDWTTDFFGKRVYLSVSSQLHLEATVLGTKRDGYCMTTAFRAEPSKGPLHLAEFLMPEWEVIGGGLPRNMSIAQFTLQHMFRTVLKECGEELDFLEKYRAEDDKEWYKAEEAILREKKKGIKAGTITKQEVTQLTKALDEEKKKRESRPSLVERLTRYTEPFVISSHEECVRLMLADVAAGKVTFDVMPTYDGDLSRQHEYYITETLFGQRPVFVRYFPRPIKAFYMPLIHTDAHGVERVDCYDLLFPFVGEVVGGSQRTHVAAELVQRMQQLKMDLKELQWYIDLRRDASLPHGGAGLGFGRAVIVMTGLHNIKDMQEFPRACGLSCFA